MIVLFDEIETKFDSLGLGVLTGATQCTVKEELNGEFSLEMRYSISGRLFDKLSLNKIIYTKANPFDEPQPFRIVSISKPIKGYVTINANHISYDTNGIPVKAIDAKTLSDVFSQIKENSMVNNRFTFRTNLFSPKTFKTTQPFNLRAILMGDDEEQSLVGVYDAELKFDKFDIHVLNKRGANRGAKVCYGQNMTDLTHEITNERLYNGILPYYHAESTSTETETEETFKQVYIVGTKEYAEDWLSFTENGEAYHPLDSNPIQIASEGDHYEEVYAWNQTYQRYEKKIYNESVQLIENVISPGWIKIVWNSFPNVKCVANAKGYFKSMTDTDWGEIKGVGDVIFEGNILKEGLSGFAGNMIIYYSEVIPSGKESTTKEVNDIKEVMLDDPIIWLNTIDAKSMTHDRILLVDLTDKFEEEPDKVALKDKAVEYIAENKLGNIYTNTKVSFIEINENQNKFKNFSHVELGDTVQIIYNDLGVNTELRVISTEYDAITDRYSSVELGTKKDTISSSTIENGDNISSLSNDVGYADITTVNKLIASTVTADFINAANAHLSKAQIDELKVSKIEMPGVIEASQYVIDNLVATMLTAQNAKIAQTLEAGSIKVNGQINIIGGSIDISGSENNETFFKVDKNGNLTANSVNVTGGSLKIGDNFSVDNEGNLISNNVKINGELNAYSGFMSIGNNFFVNENGELTISNNGYISNIGFITRTVDSDDDGTEYKFNCITNVDAVEFNDLRIYRELYIDGHNSHLMITNRYKNAGFDVPYFENNNGTRIAILVTGQVIDRTTLFNPHSDYVVTASIIGDTTMNTNWSKTFYVISQDKIGDSLIDKIRVSGPITVTIEPGQKYGQAYITEKGTGIYLGINENGDRYLYSGTLNYHEYIEPSDTPISAHSYGHFSPLTTDRYLNLGDSSHRWNEIFAINGTISTSDRNLKEQIESITDKYSEMFDELRPVTYKFKGNKHDRTHLGFIAQEVEDAMLNNGLTSMDFGGLCYDIDENQNKNYSLRYSEFIALNTMEIQKLKKRIEELEKKENDTL